MTEIQQLPSTTPLDESAGLVHPIQLEVREFSEYAVVVDARSPREYEEDHIPGAVNLPVVNDEEYAEVGTLHKQSPHQAYLVGVGHSLRNIAAQIAPTLTHLPPKSRVLVYCFRGGKRSKLWADSLRTIGFSTDVLPGGWKAYRRWVRSSLERICPSFEYHVLTGSTGAGKTRMLAALARAGEQVLDLEGLAVHRGSLIGAVPGARQPTQKFFDSLLLDRLRRFDPARPVWVEAESKKVGAVQIPLSLQEAMHQSKSFELQAAMSARVQAWREDFPHFAEDPALMVRMLEPLLPLIGKEELGRWRALAETQAANELFERVMVNHYDPCYVRSIRRNYGSRGAEQTLVLNRLDPEYLTQAAEGLVSSVRDADKAPPGH